MSQRFPGATVAPALAAIALLSGFQTNQKPDAAFAGIVKSYLSMDLPVDWDGVEKLPAIKWAPLPPTSLTNCLPDGGCFTRQGVANIGGRNVTVVATGARTMVLHLYFRNAAAPLGGAAVIAALQQVGLTADLARCPVRAGAPGTNWYRLKGEQAAAGFLSIQPPAGARRTEGFVLSQGDELPQLQPNQLALYSEECTAGAERKPVSTSKPHEVLAETIVSLLVPGGGVALYDWKALEGLPTEIEWVAGGAKAGDLSYRQDPNPWMHTGAVIYAGRRFSLLASGSPTQVKAVYFDEGGMHPRGEHMLGVVYQKGVTVQLVRCGPVYTESTNNWYRLTSPKARPAMILQSIRYDGNQVQDRYEIRLDGTLPPRDPQDRNPGTNGC